jgi:hypothetical protein
MFSMDVFHGHLSDGIKNRLRNKNTCLVIIVRDMTSQLQLLGVFINKSFKHLTWLNKDNHTVARKLLKNKPLCNRSIDNSIVNSNRGMVISARSIQMAAQAILEYVIPPLSNN